MDKVIKSYNINTIKYQGVMQYDIKEVSLNICDNKSHEVFRNKIKNRVKVEGKWYAPLDAIINGINLCGKVCAKEFIADNIDAINEYFKSNGIKHKIVVKARPVKKTQKTVKKPTKKLVEEINSDSEDDRRACEETYKEAGERNQ